MDVVGRDSYDNLTAGAGHEPLLLYIALGCLAFAGVALAVWRLIVSLCRLYRASLPCTARGGGVKAGMKEQLIEEGWMTEGKACIEVEGGGKDGGVDGGGEVGGLDVNGNCKVSMVSEI